MRSRMSHRSVVAALQVAVAVAAPLAAQDAHYWTLQNGARATLLGGTGAAVEGELSSSFYNPGALAHLTDDNALSMFVKTTTRLRATFGSDPSVEARSDMGSAAPGFFAVRLPVHIVDGDVLTFSYLVRQTSELDMSGLGISAPTIPTVALDLFVYQDIVDGWYGLSWAKPVNEEVGIGVSLFYSSVTYRQRVQNRLLDLTGVIDGYLESDDLDINMAARRLVAKGGVTWVTGPLSLGAALTLPSLRLPLSNGRMSVSRAVLSNEGDRSVQLTQSRQESLPSDYRNPLSVALGARGSVLGLNVYAAAEWFASVDEYDVLETAPFTGQAPPVETTVPITQARESVLNLGAGLAWDATQFLSVFGSVRTDESFRVAGSDSFVGLDPFDILHWTGGIGIFSDQLDVSMGVIYGSGSANDTQSPTPLPDAPAVDVHTDFTQLGFVLAFSASF